MEGHHKWVALVGDETGKDLGYGYWDGLNDVWKDLKMGTKMKWKEMTVAELHRCLEEIQEEIARRAGEEMILDVPVDEETEERDENGAD